MAGVLVGSAKLGIGVGPVRNDPGELIEPYHAVAITSVLVEPGEDDQERTFHSRTPLTGDVAGLDHDVPWRAQYQWLRPWVEAPLTAVTGRSEA